MMNLLRQLLFRRNHYKGKELNFLQKRKLLKRIKTDTNGRIPKRKTEQEIELDPHINVFYGDNAQGKTNIIEAIFLCSMGRSFRTNKDKEMIF